MKVNKILLLAVTIALLGTMASAQDDKDKGTKKGGGKRAPVVILHPEMKLAADAGTYEAPMAKIGDKPAAPWSGTTIEAAIDKTPNAGSVETVVGEVVDFSCYLQVGKHGEAHTGCAKKCFANGQPIGLLTSSGLLYVLMEEEHHPRRDGQTNLRDELTKHAGHILEVTGTASTVAGQRALFVTGYLKK